MVTICIYSIFRRWHNHLDPSVKKGDWTPEEEQALQAAHKKVRISSRHRLFQTLHTSVNMVVVVAHACLCRRCGCSMVTAGQRLQRSCPAVRTTRLRTIGTPQSVVCLVQVHDRVLKQGWQAELVIVVLTVLGMTVTTLKMVLI